MENFFEHTRQWVQGETTEAIIIMVFGVVTMAVAIVLHNLDNVPGAKVLFAPLLICGAAYTAIGGYNYFGNKDRIESYEKAYDENNLKFIRDEKARVEGFQYMYKISKAVAAVFFIATIAIFWSTSSTAWQAAGMGLSLFGLAGLVVDYFSQNRADYYYEIIVKTLNG